MSVSDSSLFIYNDVCVNKLTDIFSEVKYTDLFLCRQKTMNNLIQFNE